MKEPALSISEAEWRVMKVLWNRSPQTLVDILDQLKDTGWNTTTIQTYLARLVKKGVLNTERQGKRFLYTPTVSEEECQLSETKTFIDRIYDGSISSLVTSFIKSGDLSADELEELKRLVSEAEENQNGDR